ncbi:TPA: hypothetical protein DCG61_03260 [Patescibacteria group bacterium]|jgi:hypothetical protein|nr:hypothetical protein [Patescibacteria group bacterium]
MKKPYIGVTGIFNNKDLVFALVAAFTESGYEFPENYQLMIGVLASFKTISGLPSKNFPNRYPAVEDIPDLFPTSTKDYLLNLIHYNSSEPDLSSQFNKLVEISGPNLGGFQLNICWPDPKELHKFREEGHQHAIVLQIGREAFGVINKNPTILADKISAEYSGLIDYVLLDPSGGEGKEMNIDKTDEYLSELYGRGLNDKIRFGIAGGLHSGNLESIRPLVEKYDSLSIDAEGKLRHPHDDTMNHKELARFISAAKRLMTSP